MTILETARGTIRDFIDAPHGDFSPRPIMRALYALDSSRHEDDRAMVERAFDVAPGLTNYDHEGNWIGPVTYEGTHHA